MSTNRVAVVEANLDAYLESAVAASDLLAPDAPLRVGTGLTARVAVELWEDQVLSRCLDVAARELKREGEGFYTISSAGHEQNAIVGAQLRTSDPTFLHYRSGAFMAARSRKVDDGTPLFDTLLSFCAAKDDPVSSGRHKVWGSRETWVPPQTSTIASHVPKAVGAAYSLRRARKLGIDTGLPEDAITCCTFGDASVNHATALAGINSARYAWRRMNPTPVLFVCEDNQRGISVETPRRWIRDFFSRLEHLRYFEASGELEEVWDTVSLAIQTCRTTRQPTFLRLRCHRLWGHAGTDVQSAYMSQAEIEEGEAKDPVLTNARRLVESGAATPAQLREILRSTRDRVRAASDEARTRPRLSSAAEVVRPLAPAHPERWRAAATAPIDAAARAEVFGSRLPESAKAPTRRTLGARINDALHDEMIRRDGLICFGEDVGRKGGVYGITQNLQAQFGRSRCFDTLLDETTILGVAQGASLVGLLPVPEIPYLAYLHNAIDQIRGEACSLQFFSDEQFANPMVVRIAGLAYQRGFGGHFHNDNSIGALREIPGLTIACPSNGADAVRMLRGALAMAEESGRVVAFLEPIALYHMRDLFEEGDGLWLSDYPVPDGSADSALLPGEVGLAHADHGDVLVVTYANGYRLALRAARRLAAEGIRARVMDVRWLNPLPMEQILEHADECGAVLVADECRATGAGIADAVVSGLVERGYRGRLRTARSADTYIPLGPAADVVLLSEEDIVAGAREVTS
ncbi:MAG: thiamine pyrophosphate-dependent enzyme [Planctomycetota bacterium]|jgi:2-oxoisovalerate dehydrogenase E1 component